MMKFSLPILIFSVGLILTVVLMILANFTRNENTIGLLNKTIGCAAFVTIVVPVVIEIFLGK